MQDFCEDLLAAHQHVRPGSPDAESAYVHEARGKGHIPGKGVIPSAVRGWQPGDSTGKPVDKAVTEW